jgi:acetyl coenzyme A synthetase (ADP forming)-like protein
VARGELYPAHREADVILRDGRTVHIRPVRPDDEPGLFRFLRGLSEESRAMRFFSATTEEVLADMARRGSHVDYRQRFAFVATTGPDERVVGHALYEAQEGGTAEVAFAVADDFQGRGLGTILLGHLAEVASSQGIREFVAFVLPENQRMLEVFRESGFPIQARLEGAEFVVTMPTSLSPDALERFDRREQIAARNALQAFLAPRSVAVIGASRRRGTIGGEIFHNLLSYGFAGPVYPVNPSADVVQSVPAYPTVEAIPGPVDLAVIAVPAEEVTRVAEQCARKGVRGLVVISAGFAETGDEGRARQAELLRICRASGMRLIGPNCMGLVNTDPRVRLNATFAPHPPPPGRVGFLTQSGALGLAIIEYAGALGLGLSSFVSVGNKADISGNDLLNYWETDPATDVILLYLESFGNPRKFSRIARRVGRSKPIAAVKSGRSPAGARATSSHTGALVASSDVTVDALFRQAGVIRTDTLEELFDVAALLVHQPPPAGRRVGIITNGGGPGILCADACEAEGLEVPPLAPETQERLRAGLLPHASVQNPVDMIAAATPEHYRHAISVVAADPSVDALIVIFVPPLVTNADDVARAIVEATTALTRTKPVLTVFMSARGVPAVLQAGDVRIPSYAFPEAAAIALARAARYGEWRRRPQEPPPELQGIRREDARALLLGRLARGEGWLPPDDVFALLGAYGLPVVPQRVVATPEEAGEAAALLDGPVALKAFGPGILHKTDVGAIHLNLRGREEVRSAAAAMASRLASHGITPAGFVVQAMAPPGVEMIVGVVSDRHFGPVVVCGAGGTFVEILKDISVRLTPLTRADAVEMIRELKTYPLLAGFRGQPPGDVAALGDVLLRVSALAEDHPHVAELDLNPVIVHPRGVAVVDARVRIAPAEPVPSLMAKPRPT